MTETGETHVYKLLTGDDWQAASASGVTSVPIDQQDGYVHLSTRAQVEETARLHFASAKGIRLLRFAVADLPLLDATTAVRHCQRAARAVLSRLMAAR